MSNRKYRGTAIQMLLALRLIADNALTIIEKVKAMRPKWDDKYFQNLIVTINTILKNDFALDTTLIVKEKTEEVQAKESRAKDLLQKVKTQVDIEFRKDPVKCKRILTALGLNFVPKLAVTSQDKLIEILVAFQKNLPGAIQADLLATGMDEQTLTEIVALADTFYNLNAQQEVLKTGKKDMSDSLNGKLNDLYDEVITISKMASALMESKLDAEKLSYSVALKQVGYRETKKDAPSSNPTK